MPLTGLTVGEDGGSHQVEDVALMRFAQYDWYRLMGVGPQNIEGSTRESPAYLRLGRPAVQFI